MATSGMPPAGAGGMSGAPQSGEISEQLAQMMGSAGAGGGSSSGGAASAAQMQQMMGQQGMPGQQQEQQRPVGTVAEEFKMGFTDIFKGIKDFFSLQTWLGINPHTLDPQQQAHAKQLHARYQQLDQEQQAVAQQMYQERMQRKKMQEQEDAQKRQIEAQQKANSVEMPSSPKKGAVGPGAGKSKKQNAMTKLKQDRTTLNNTQGE